MTNEQLLQRIENLEIHHQKLIDLTAETLAPLALRVGVNSLEFNSFLTLLDKDDQRKYVKSIRDMAKKCGAPKEVLDEVEKKYGAYENI